MKAPLPMSQRKSGIATKLASCIIFLALLGNWIFYPNPVDASSSAKVSFEDVAVFYQFGIQATFQARLNSTLPVSEVVLLIQSGTQSPINQSLNLAENNDVIYQLDLQKNSIRPFGLVDYWFKGRLTDGTTFESDRFSFDYIDNRFEWQSTTDNRFEVFWNSADLALGDTVLQVALDGLRSAVSYLPISPPSLFASLFIPQAKIFRTRCN